MFIVAETLDDLIRAVIQRLLREKARVRPSRGSIAELTGVLLEIRNPRARLSRSEDRGKLFSCLGELLWYLSKSNQLSFIEYYINAYRQESDDGLSVHGGYGPRLFSMRGTDQMSNVIALLKNNKSSRRAVVQLFNAEDIATSHKDIPCTCTLQFMVRDELLHMLTSMRSNDAYLGLPHDVFAFTMLQEVMARSIGVEIGTYKHAVGSLHLYDKHREKARRYLREGIQPRVPMPRMPDGDPWPSIEALLAAEANIREGRDAQIDLSHLSSYWADLIRLLQLHRHFKDKRAKEIRMLRPQLSVRFFDPYIEDRKRALAKEPRPGPTL